MQLIDDWKHAHRLHCVQVAGFGFIFSSIATGVAATGAVVPWFSVLRPWEGFALAAVVFLGTIVARIIKQKKLHDNPKA